MPIKIYANPYTVYYRNATNSILSLFYHDFLLFWWLVMNWQRWDLNSESHSSCLWECHRTTSPFVTFHFFLSWFSLYYVFLQSYPNPIYFSLISKSNAQDCGLIRPPLPLFSTRIHDKVKYSWLVVIVSLTFHKQKWDGGDKYSKNRFCILGLLENELSSRTMDLIWCLVTWY